MTWCKKKKKKISTRAAIQRDAHALVMGRRRTRLHSQARRPLPLQHVPALRCCSDSCSVSCLHIRDLSLKNAWPASARPGKMHTLWCISRARKRNSLCQREKVLGSYGQETLRIPHLLSFKGAFEAFLDVVQCHTCSTFSYDRLEETSIFCGKFWLIVLRTFYQYRQRSWPTSQSKIHKYRHAHMRCVCKTAKST